MMLQQATERCWKMVVKHHIGFFVYTFAMQIDSLLVDLLEMQIYLIAQLPFNSPTLLYFSDNISHNRQ